jgi:hypothetical protein
MCIRRCGSCSLKSAVRNADGQETKIQDAWVTPDAQVFVPLVFSPDCKKIAFQTQPVRGGSYEIYVIDADGTNLTRLTNDQRHDLLVGWIRNWAIF